MVRPLNAAENLHLQRLRQALIEAAQPENVPGMKAYWKNQFEFLGLKAPVRAQLLKPVTILPEGVEVEQLARAL